MITTATVYVTTDMRHFFTAAEAEEHEATVVRDKKLEEVVNNLSVSEQIRGYMKKAILAWEASK